MHGQDGLGHDASQGQVSAARRFGKPAEDVEDVLEIVLRDVAPGEPIPPRRFWEPFHAQVSKPPARGRQKRSVIRKLQLMDGEQQQTFSGLGF